jgi:hypothetical protein
MFVESHSHGEESRVMEICVFKSEFIRKFTRAQFSAGLVYLLFLLMPFSSLPLSSLLFNISKLMFIHIACDFLSTHIKYVFFDSSFTPSFSFETSFACHHGLTSLFRCTIHNFRFTKPNEILVSKLM